jgi:nucleoside-diphosphate-sugar epimerase
VPDPINPRYSYGGGKIICELLALNYGRKHLDRVLVFRPHNVYGPDMGREHVIPQLVERLLERARGTEGPVELPIQGTGKETRAFVFIDDLVDGVLRMIAAGKHRNIYHIGSDEEITIERLVQEIGRCLNREVRPLPGQLQPGGTPRRCPNIGKMRALGYAPRVSLPEGLTKTIQWYVDNQRNRSGSDVRD